MTDPKIEFGDLSEAEYICHVKYYNGEERYLPADRPDKYYFTVAVWKRISEVSQKPSFWEKVKQIFK